MRTHPASACAVTRLHASWLRCQRPSRAWATRRLHGAAPLLAQDTPRRCWPRPQLPHARCPKTQRRRLAQLRLTFTCVLTGALLLHDVQRTCVSRRAPSACALAERASRGAAFAPPHAAMRPQRHFDQRVVPRRAPRRAATQRAQLAATSAAALRVSVSAWEGPAPKTRASASSSKLFVDVAHTERKAARDACSTQQRQAARRRRAGRARVTHAAYSVRRGVTRPPSAPPVAACGSSTATRCP